MHVWGHFKTITRHRHIVRHLCFQVGLYWQGLTHDLSKYSPGGVLGRRPVLHRHTQPQCRGAAEAGLFHGLDASQGPQQAPL